MIEEVIEQGNGKTTSSEEIKRLKRVVLKLKKKLEDKEKDNGKKKYLLKGGSVRIIKRVRGRRLIVERIFSEEQANDEDFWHWLIDTYGDDLCELPSYRRWYGRSRERERERE